MLILAIIVPSQRGIILFVAGTEKDKVTEDGTGHEEHQKWSRASTAVAGSKANNPVRW
jgi:hypothetical protein